MSETPMDSTSNVNSPDEPMSTSQPDEPHIKTPLCTDSEDEESVGISAVVRSKSQRMRTPDSDFEPASSASTKKRKGSKRQRSSSTKADSRVPVRPRTVPWYPDNELRRIWKYHTSYRQCRRTSKVYSPSTSKKDATVSSGKPNHSRKVLPKASVPSSTVEPWYTSRTVTNWL